MNLRDAVKALGGISITIRFSSAAVLEWIKNKIRRKR